MTTSFRENSILILISFLYFNFTYSQDKIIPIWENAIPESIINKTYTEEYRKDSQGKVIGVSKVSNPSLSLFLPERTVVNRTAVLILPGGGYGHLSIEKEGNQVARWLNKSGVTAFVLKYRLPSDDIMKNKSTAPLSDAQQALRIIRKNAKQWDLDSDKIGVLGFSAGGHLAATLSTRFDKKVTSENDQISARPDFSVLVYPVISMKDALTHKGSQIQLLGQNASERQKDEFSTEELVNATTPPTFLVHATNDKAVPAENSLAYYRALKKHNIPTELHLYEDGGHGFGLGSLGTHTKWPEALKNWMQHHDYIEEETALVFSYFKGNGEDGLHLAYSKDGYKWEALNNDESFLKPKLGQEKLMRDPCIIKGGDGKYHMVWTVGWTEKGIGYASSNDLVNWSEQKFIPVMEHEAEARNTWAPELTYDKINDEYMIYWASTIRGKFPETQSDKDDGYNHRLYFTTTKDFEKFSSTKLLYEPGFNVIDASIQKFKDNYVMFLKDETREPAEKNIRIAYSKQLTGPYGEASEPITGEYWAEGPSGIRFENTWMVYFDKYIEKQYGAVKSVNLKTWEDISEQVSFPDGARHGTVLEIPLSILHKLKAYSN